MLSRRMFWRLTTKKTFYNPKTVYVTCLGIFELGSLICGAAPNSNTLIVGRAIAGLGSAGMFSGAITLIVYLVPLQKRPAYTGMFGAVFAVASVAGPLLGGMCSPRLQIPCQEIACLRLSLDILTILTTLQGFSQTKFPGDGASTSTCLSEES